MEECVLNKKINLHNIIFFFFLSNLIALELYTTMYCQSTCRKERIYGVGSAATFILLFAKLINESFIF